MGAARDNDAIDLTDNDIVHLGNFPLTPRLRTLFLAQNRITTIQANIATTIPNLTTLVLTKNRIAELADLDPLGGFKKLVYLSLIGNPVTNKENYRYYLIYRIPTLRFLDFAKIRDVERQKARQLFGTLEDPTDLAQQIMKIKSKGGFVPTLPGDEDRNAKQRIWTDEEKRKMKAAIQRAGSLAEMAALEKDFAEGRIPKYVLEGPDLMEM